jgi:integrase
MDPPGATSATAIAGLSCLAGVPHVAVVLLVGFDTFLRPSEMVRIKPEDVTFLNGSAVVQLGLTKGVQRRGGSEEVVIRDPLLIQWLFECCRRTLPNTTLLQMDLTQFRIWFRRCTTSLQLNSRQLQLYSVRRGGLTQAYIAGASVSVLAFKARWLEAKLARVYITEGKQLAQAAGLDAADTQRLKQAAAPLCRLWAA